MDNYNEKIIKIFTKKKIQQTIRIDFEIIKRLDDCLKRVNKNGINITRTKAIKLATELYLELIKQEMAE